MVLFLNSHSQASPNSMIYDTVTTTPDTGMYKPKVQNTEIQQQRSEKNINNKTKFDKHRSLITSNKLYLWYKKTFSYDTVYVQKPKYIFATALHNKMIMDFHKFNAYDGNDGMSVDLHSAMNYNIGISFSVRPFTISHYVNINKYYDDITDGLSHTSLHMVNSRFMFDATLHYNSGNQTLSALNIDHENVDIDNTTISGYRLVQVSAELDLFINPQRYCHSAAYSCTSIQKRSTGSFIAGVSYKFNHVFVDIDGLPDELDAFKAKAGAGNVKLNTHDYCLDVGYAYNLVFCKHFVANITLIPKVGLKVYDLNDSDKKYFLAYNTAAYMGIAYNHDRFFASLNVHHDGSFNFQDHRFFFLFINDSKFSLGVRF